MSELLLHRLLQKLLLVQRATQTARAPETPRTPEATAATKTTAETATTATAGKKERVYESLKSEKGTLYRRKREGVMKV